jgi:transforming growth factor-beta-induced protein
VLLYHAVAGVALSTDLSDGQMIATIQGQDVTVTITGGNVFINDAQVIMADITADNGVVHVIDAVLVPQSNPQPTTVVDIIVNSPVHTTLETAVIAAGLADDLSGDGPFTVFAPTDAAFAALPAGVLDALLADPTGDLASVLLYHVVAGEALSSSLNSGQNITTLNGASIVVSITGGNVFINDAQVIMADIMADNGVVHVIDAVLTPSSSVNEANINSALVYPNPAADQLTVTMPSMLNHATYSVYSTTGALVTTGMMTTTTTTINVDMLSQGMYQLKINNGAECVTRTFMKK